MTTTVSKKVVCSGGKHNYYKKPNRSYKDKKGMWVQYIGDTVAQIQLCGSPRVDKVKNDTSVKILKDRVAKTTIWKPNPRWGQGLDRIANLIDVAYALDMFSAYV
jgi:hypothetical protein